jgi:hypothetical protein|nr:MAG TPA: tail component [Caudoviricetes sp.]
MTIAEILQDKYTVCHPPYMGDAAEYVTYQLITQSTTLYAEGVEAETSVLYAVDYYTKTVPFEAKLLEIKRLLQAAGWTCVVNAEIYEKDTVLYHIAMTAAHVGGVYA